jgi:hypothetical protein
MQDFLGVTIRPSTLYKMKCDPRNGGYSYEEWLIQYAKQLRRDCEAKLVNDYNATIGKRLFAEKFSSFQEFSLQ